PWSGLATRPYRLCPDLPHALVMSPVARCRVQRIFRSGWDPDPFNQLDVYVWQRLRSLRVKRAGSKLRVGEAEHWTSDYLSKASDSIAYEGPSATRELRNATTREITGKPCAGNPHERFERGS